MPDQRFCQEKNEEVGTCRFPGIGCSLLHVPDGEIHTPFAIRENICVEHPVWDGDRFFFLAVDFSCRLILIYAYVPAGRRLECIKELPLSMVKDCYNLRITVSPVTLYQYRQEEPVCDILWPQKQTLRLHDTETLMYRDENILYCSQWTQEPHDREKIIVRDLDTKEIIESFDGYLCRVQDGVFWKIED